MSCTSLSICGSDVAREGFPQLLDRDRLRIRKVALQASLCEKKCWTRSCVMVELFGNFTELLLVEDHPFRSASMDIKRGPLDLLGYMECDVADPRELEGTVLVVSQNVLV